jgi:outer membrane protease
VINVRWSIHSDQEDKAMKKAKSKVVAGLAILLAASMVSAAVAQEEKKAEKEKAQKVSGDIGLLDTEKNYMIVVTKEGKLMTLDFNQKTKATELKEKEAKLSDIGLGSSAVVEYSKKGDKNVVSKIEFTPAKGGD